jgi:hypothetical protein
LKDNKNITKGIALKDLLATTDRTR